MSVRRKNVMGRLTLFRTCGTCGKSFPTTADSPWVRQVPRDGKKQATTYYCSTGCFQASYKHIGWYDGLYEQRKKERDAKRDVKEKNRRYREAHAEELRKRRMEKYWEDPEAARADNRYYRKKRKLLAAENRRTDT